MRTRKHGQSGRTRVVAIVVLVLLIGALSAVVVPRLIHETRSPLARQGSARVCLALPEDSKPGSAGDVWIEAHLLDPIATRRGRASLDPDMKTCELLASLREVLLQGTERQDDGIEVVGNCLCFEAVTAVGGDPGATGATMSFSLAGRAREPMVARLELTGPPAGVLIEDVVVHIAFSARSDIADGNADADVSQVVLKTEWIGARDLIARLAAHLVKEGWAAEVIEDEREAGTQATLDVQTLPGGRGIGAAILNVQYDMAGLGEAPEPPYLWVLSFGT